MKVKAIWEFEADVECLDPKQIDIAGVAKDTARCELMYMLRKRELIADDFVFSVNDEDSVRHAEWVTKVKEFTNDPENVYVTSHCSNCDELDGVKTIQKEIWFGGWDKVYKPKGRSNYCRNCGCKMDLRELYEQYKRDWCDTRGYKLEDMDESVGVNGECYVCFDEWYNNEYRARRGE